MRDSGVQCVGPGVGWVEAQQDRPDRDECVIEVHVRLLLGTCVELDYGKGV